MAQQNASMSTIRSQFFATYFSTRMRHQPRMILRIQFPFAEAHVVSGNFRWQIIGSAFRAAPLNCLLLLRNEFAQVVIVSHIQLLVHLFHGCAVTSPPLNAVQMEERVAALARPNVVGSLNGCNANETSGRSGLEYIFKEFLRLVQMALLSAVAFEYRLKQGSFL